MSEPTDRVIEALAGLGTPAKPQAGGWIAKCPGHADGKPSLSIATGDDGRALLNCHAGCDFDQIVAGLGLGPRDLFASEEASAPPRSAPAGDPWRIVASYVYEDAAGRPLYRVTRHANKQFPQHRADGKGEWIKGRGDVGRVLYRLPEVLRAAAAGAAIYVVEGEKDADNLRGLGLVATSASEGATAKWEPAFTEALHGATVTVIPDADEAGRAHAAKVAAALHAERIPVRVLELPGLPPKGDATDWIEGMRQDGRDDPAIVEVLGALAAAARPWVPAAAEQSVIASTLGRVRAEWLDTANPPAPRSWLVCHPNGDGLLPRGKVGALVAAGGTGKTLAVLELAVAVATGRRWLDYFEIGDEARGGRVLLVLGEEDEEEVRRRLYSIGRAYDLTPEERRAVEAGIKILPLAGKHAPLMMLDPEDGRSLIETSELHALRDRANEAGRLALVAIDPISRFAGPTFETENAAATRTIQALETLTTATGSPTVLACHHTSKASRQAGGADSRGSSAITDGVRWVASLRSEGGSVWFQQDKSNYSVPMDEPIRLVRGDGGVLRAASHMEQAAFEEEETQRQDGHKAARLAKTAARVAGLEEALLAAVRTALAPLTRRDQITALVVGARVEREDAFSRLVTSGRLVKVGPAWTAAYV